MSAQHDKLRPGDWLLSALFTVVLAAVVAVLIVVSCIRPVR